MRIALGPRAEDEATVTLAGRATFGAEPVALRYPTRTGALLRVDGVVRGAFDAKHRTIVLPALPGEHELVLQVERRSLPTAGLPSGNGPKWRWLLARAAQRPPRALDVLAPDERARPVDANGVPLVGHAHLDVAWLWTYEDTKRKAVRTFATALRLVARDPRFVFAQSMPQLYAWAAALDDGMLARIRAHAGDGWDASVATMWVEPDLHAPSGESILRQFVHGIGWTREHLGVEPSVAWLPDTFGFPSTFPQLAAHAGVPFFVTTKLLWNETTRWPFPQFRWIGDDGSQVVAAVVAGYEGPLDAKKIARARGRAEIAIHGWGDGGGGPTDADLAAVPAAERPWTRVDAWMRDVAARTLPDYRGELYLETHRGTYTTQRLVKSGNAWLERALEAAEESAAWCVAVRAPITVRRALADDLRSAWRIVLRAQFHDVISGTAIAAAYREVEDDYRRAAAIVERVAETSRGVLPRTDLRRVAAAPRAPVADEDGWLFENAYVRARVRRDGTIVELGAAHGRNVVALANGLAAYVDRPRAWDAWNIDAGYVKRPVPVRPGAARIDDDALVVQVRIGKSSLGSLRIQLLEDEPWLRVDLFVIWRERHVLLRAEHRLALAANAVRYGQPHGTLLREATPRNAPGPRFEVPGQRWAHATDGDAGLAVFTTDLYGWNGVALPGGGLKLGTSLLRAPRWPDPTADFGEHRLAYALVPTAGAAISALEQAWQLYANEPRVRLFTCDDPAVLVVATYPSEDADGVVVRVRECDGERRAVRLRCGGRMRSAQAVDALERAAGGTVAIEDEFLAFELAPFALRSLLVRF